MIGILVSWLVACGNVSDAPVATARAQLPDTPTAPQVASATPRAVGGPVATRLLPKEVRVEGDATAEPEAAFDGSVARALESHGEAVTLRVRFARTERLEAVVVRGPTEGTLTFQRDVDGHIADLPGAARITATTPGWHRVALDTPVDVESLRVRWAPTTTDARLAEIELWGAGPYRAVVPEGQQVDRLLQRDGDPSLTFAAEPAQSTISKPEERRPGAGAFTATVVGDPKTWARAFLRYELRGLSHWTAARRAINGHPFAGGHRPVPGVEGGMQVEEIDPTWLRSGVNTVRFAPVDDHDPVGYTVRALQIIGVTADALTSAQTTHGARALTDGDPDSGVGLSAPSTMRGPGRASPAPDDIRWTFATPTTIHEIALLVTRAWTGSGELILEHDGTLERRPLPVRDLATGWHRIPIVPPANAATLARLVLQTSGEQSGRIAEATLATSAEPAENRARIVLTWPRRGECIGTEGLLRGYIAHPTTTVAGARLSVDGVSVGLTRDDGSFEVVVPAGSARALAFAVILPNGEQSTQTVSLDDCTEAPSPPNRSVAQRGTALEDVGAPFGQWVRVGHGATLTYGDVKIEVPPGAVDRDTRITIRPLTSSQVPRLDDGMTNVSPEAKGFRFGPHGFRFRRPVRITLPYERAALPPGMTEADVGVFFYNEALGRWQTVPRVRDERGARVVAASEHFTDFVASTLATPETPQAASFNPNAMRGLDPGDPAASVTTIAAPEANSTGSASLAYPLEVPPGRHGMQPQLAITYDSEHLNGWLGVGWNLELPKVELDTRFGVPRYDGVTDRYLLDGALLVSAGSDDSGCKVYRRRIEGAFERIRRCGTDPAHYFWSVTDRSGTTSTFGITPAGRLADHRTGNIFRWALQEVLDTSGNRMVYAYTTDEGNADAPAGSTGEHWSQLYPADITYTSHVSGTSEDLPAHYKVAFTTSSVRTDVLSSARAGFDVRTRRRLDAVTVYEGANVVRVYQLQYVVGDFGKSLLHVLEMKRDAVGPTLYGHTFEYNTAPRDGAGNHRFGEPTLWASGLDDDDRVDSSYNYGGGFNAFVGLGPSFCDPHVGGGVHVSASGTTSSYTLTDVNGDGIPDLVSPSGRIRLGKLATASGATGGYESTSAQSPEAIATNQELTVDASIAGHIWSEAAGFGGDFSWTWNSQSRMLTDVNGDGRVDLIHGPLRMTSGGTTVHALDVHLNPFGQMRTGFGVGPGLAADYQLGGFVPLPQQRQVDTAVANRLRGLLHPVDTVLRWISPIRGTIVIRGHVKRRGPIGDEDEGTDGVVATIYRSTGTTVYGTSTTTTTIWQHAIPVGSFETCTPSSSGCGSGLVVTNVEPGERFYFRLSGLDDPRGDTTEWDPEIEITDFDASALPCDPAYPQACVTVPPGSVAHNYRLSTDFRLADPDLSSWTAPVTGAVSVQGTVELPPGASATELDVYVRHREWAGSSPSWYESVDWNANQTDLQAMIAARNAGTLHFTQDWYTTVPVSATGAVSVSWVPVGQGDQLVFALRLGSNRDAAGFRFNPEIRYTWATLRLAELGGVPTSTNIGACSLDTTTNTRFCALNPPVGALTRLPRVSAPNLLEKQVKGRAPCRRHFVRRVPACARCQP